MLFAVVGFPIQGQLTLSLLLIVYGLVEVMLFCPMTTTLSRPSEHGCMHSCGHGSLRIHSRCPNILCLPGDNHRTSRRGLSLRHHLRGV